MNKEKNMSQNTIQVSTHENMSQLVQTAPTPNSVITATDEHIPARHEQPASRWCNMATGEMYPIGFGMREELFNTPLIKVAIYQPNGLESTRVRITESFKGQWGVERSRLENQVIAESQALDPLQKEFARITKLLTEIPITKTITGIVLPSSSAARFGWCGLVFALIILQLLAIANTAAYLRWQAQGIFAAVLMAAPLLFVSLSAKFVTRKLTQAARNRVGWILGGLGVAAFAIFIGTIALRANPVSTADIMDGTACLGTGYLTSCQLASQIILEFVMATALWYWLLELTAINSKLISNPDAEMLSSRLAGLQSLIEPIRNRLGTAKGNLEEMNGSLNHCLQKAETIFNAHLERERRLVAAMRDLNCL